MDIHFLFPLSADVTLCGELAEDIAVAQSINMPTCARCRELLTEVSRQALLEVGKANPQLTQNRN